MVTGVTEGYEKRLEIVGVGYRVLSKGPTQLEFQLGLLPPDHLRRPRGHHLHRRRARPGSASQGIDKQLVGEVAANIRKLRKPEPYKGKGVRYAGERRPPQGRKGW